jgi:hypothetical protein
MPYRSLASLPKAQLYAHLESVVRWPRAGVAPAPGVPALPAGPAASGCCGTLSAACPAMWRDPVDDAYGVALQVEQEGNRRGFRLRRAGKPAG